jgi:type II secretory pathway component PulF
MFRVRRLGRPMVMGTFGVVVVMVVVPVLVPMDGTANHV